MRAMVPPRLVPASPQTNRLYPGAESSAPIFKARSARSCPMNPSRSSACAVVSKGMRESSHLQRNFSRGSSACLGASLVVMKSLRARYSSTLGASSHDETNLMLPSRHRRAVWPLHVHRKNPGGRGHQDGSEHQTEHSEHGDAAHDADKDHEGAEFRAAAKQYGPQDIVHDRGYSGTNSQKEKGAPPMSREAEPQRRGNK